jgi:hypothetical protein
MAKNISSKEAYFQRPNNTLTLEAWEAFKQANPRTEYVGEICWDLHDTMIMRGKPELDSMVVIKKLLAELNIEFTMNVEYLEITSDLAGKAIMVLDIENDELVLQLEKAGATVVYVTSNWNYNTTIPNRYFEMYDDRAHETYPATDKRNLFDGKNIIVRPISFYDYKTDSFCSILYNIINEFKETLHMQIDKVLMNPPYDGNTHLKVLEKVLSATRDINPNCEVVSIQPARWLEDPLAEYKQGSDYKTFQKSIIKNLSKFQLVDTNTAQKKFKIGVNGDLGIYTFNNKKAVSVIVFNPVAQQVFNKIITNLPSTIYAHCEQNKVDGWRCKINELRPINGSGNNFTTEGFSARMCSPQLVCFSENGLRDNVFFNGYNAANTYWTETMSKRQYSKDIGAAFPYSIKMKSEQEAHNFEQSCVAQFYLNLIHLIKFDQHMPLRFLPYMEDYSKVWTDKDYCEFFGLTEEETEFMCRTVDDYRVKDFINYISLED